MAILALLQAPQVQVLGITMVTGNAWRDEETLHTLRMLELTGHADVPVAKGAVFPLVRTQEETRLASALDGKVTWLGAWGQGPTTLVETPGGVTPMTPDHLTRTGPTTFRPCPRAANAQAHRRRRGPLSHPPGARASAPGHHLRRRPADQHCARHLHRSGVCRAHQGLVVMGGSLNPQTDDPEFATSPRHEFNFWFDPEATHIVLRADWPRIDVTTVDVSIKAPFTQKMLDEISKSQTPAARYIAAWSQDRYYLWDELTACAWLDPRSSPKRSSSTWTST
jgi:purine nucleosidase